MFFQGKLFRKGVSGLSLILSRHPSSFRYQHNSKQAEKKRKDSTAGGPLFSPSDLDEKKQRRNKADTPQVTKFNKRKQSKCSYAWDLAIMSNDIFMVLLATDKHSFWYLMIRERKSRIGFPWHVNILFCCLYISLFCFCWGGGYCVLAIYNQ